MVQLAENTNMTALAAGWDAKYCSALFLQCSAGSACLDCKELRKVQSPGQAVQDAERSLRRLCPC